MLREDQPWKAQEIQRLVDEDFGVQYHPDYLHRFLRNLGLSYAKPRPDNPDEILEERADEEADTPQNKRTDDESEGWVVDGDICTEAELSLVFVTHLIHNHSTIPTDCGTLTVRHYNKRW